jgi:hypothetical protein
MQREHPYTCFGYESYTADFIPAQQKVWKISEWISLINQVSSPTSFLSDVFTSLLQHHVKRKFDTWKIFQCIYSFDGARKQLLVGEYFGTVSALNLKPLKDNPHCLLVFGVLQHGLGEEDVTVVTV